MRRILALPLVAVAAVLAELTLPARAAPVAAHAPVIPDLTPWLARTGRPGPAAWRHAAHLSIPYEINPAQNGPAPVSTRVELGYTAKALWLRYLAEDMNPGAIQARYRVHDDLSTFSDDYVGVYLSPFEDTQWAYEFMCTAGGVEWDAFRLQGKEYASWNAVWGCRARRTRSGYRVVMRIPFASIKFPRSDQSQRWGMLFYRNWPRSLDHQLLSRPLDFNSKCTLCSMQVLRTARPITASPANFQVIPALTLIRTDTPGRFSTSLRHHTIKLDASLDARWILLPELSWSATINPNFSAVAPDVLQLSVNRQFALNYTENRPFFQQGTQVFNTPGVRLTTDMYTPSGAFVDTLEVADPRWASKLVGQAGPNVIGLLATDDQATNILLPGREISRAHSFNFSTHDALVRYRYDFGASDVGVLATDRTGGGYDSGAYELDSLWQIDPSDTLTTLIGASNTTYPGAVAKVLGTKPGTIHGLLWLADFSRNRRNYNFDINALHISDGFRADLGYLPQVGYNQLAVLAQYDFYAPDTAWWQKGGFGLISNATESTGNGPMLDRKAKLYTFVHAHYQTHIDIYATREQQHLGDKTFGLNYYEIDATVQPTDWLNVQVDVVGGDGIDYIGVRKGKMLSVTTTLAITPGRHLNINFVNATEDFNRAGQRLFTADLYDVRVDWYFNTHLFFNIIGQEQDVRYNIALYPAGTLRRSRKRGLATQWQVGYQLNPWTVFYAGSSEGFHQGPGNALVPEQRTYYLQASYYFQP